MIRNPRVTRISALALALVLGAFPAYAAGPLGNALTYIQSNVLTDVETLAIIFLGVALFAMQVRWQLVIAICAGVWILANADSLRGVLGG